MATSGKKASMGAAVGLIAAGAGIAAYYFLYLSKAEEDTPAEDIPDNNEAVPEEEEPKEVSSNHNLVVTENIDDLQNEVDACGKTPPSTLVVEEMVTKKAAAAAFIGQKLNQNVHFQKFNQNKGLDVSKEVEVKETVEDVKEPEVIEKKSDSNIELVKVVASDIVTNLSPIVTKEQDQDHELVTSNLSSFVTVTNDNLQDTNGATAINEEADPLDLEVAETGKGSDEFVEKERCHSPSTAQIDTEVQVNSVEEVKKRSISPEQEAFKKVLKTSSPSPVKETSPVKDTSPPLMEDEKDESRSKSSSPEITEIEKISSSEEEEEEEEVSPLREEKSESPEIEKQKSPSPPEKSPVPPVPPGNSLVHGAKLDESNGTKNVELGKKIEGKLDVLTFDSDDEEEVKTDPALQKIVPEKDQNKSLPIEKSPSPVKQPKRSQKFMSPVKEKSPSPLKMVVTAESPVQSPGPAGDQNSPISPSESPEKKQDTPPRTSSPEKEPSPQIELRPRSMYRIPTVPSMKSLKSMESSVESIDNFVKSPSFESPTTESAVKSPEGLSKTNSLEVRSPSPLTVSKSLTTATATKRSASSDYEESSEDNNIKSDSDDSEAGSDSAATGSGKTGRHSAVTGSDSVAAAVSKEKKSAATGSDSVAAASGSDNDETNSTSGSEDNSGSSEESASESSSSSDEDK